jgi:4-alpha-glucanotransferase
MDDAAVRELAHRAGIAVQWIDYANKRHDVPLDSLRRILAAMRLPCDSAADLAHSRHLLEQQKLPPLVTATAGQSIQLPVRAAGERSAARLTREDGSVADLAVRRTARGITVPPIQTIGYHTLEIGPTRLALAVSPPRCLSTDDIAPGERLAGLTAQIYGLRRPGDCGIGDMSGVSALARGAGALGIAALSLSPAHALFSADHSHFSPYSPSNRLFYNPLLADPAAVFDDARVERARTAAHLDGDVGALETAALIDWPKAARNKMALLRCLFDDFVAHDLTSTSASNIAVDFAAFRAAAGAALEQHALFEALHATQLKGDPAAWHWQSWPASWRDPHGDAVQHFAQDNRRDVLFHIFLQWIADRSFAKAQQQAKADGMRIGLVADLAVGMSPSGSYAWACGDTLLGGLQIGAPPDLFNLDGQSWGLTTFSPYALREAGFGPFIATLRACLRHAGGVRIDHVLGFKRIWVIPEGAQSAEGAYLTYPLDDLFRLTALESHRHRAVVIGEDLGTVPRGFRARLKRAGIYGMNVLWFERTKTRFRSRSVWPPEAIAMTSTHDLATVAGWWRGCDLKMRAQLGMLADLAHAEAERHTDRRALWHAFASAKVAHGDPPAADDGGRAADAAVKFIAATPSRLALLPLEDALACAEQPNLPGTIDEHPNWRRRYPGDAGALLDSPDVQRRVASLVKRGAL